MQTDFIYNNLKNYDDCSKINNLTSNGKGKIFIETCPLSGRVYHYSFKNLKMWLTIKRQLKLKIQRIKGLNFFLLSGS